MPSRLLALLLLAVTACASGSSGPRQAPSPGTTVAPMTKDAYLKAADAICTVFNTKTEQVPEPKTADEYVTAMTQLLALLDQANMALRALNPPAELRAEIETKLLAPNDAEAEAVRAAMPKFEAAAKSDDDAAAAVTFNEVIGKMAKVADGQEAWATGFGLTECAS